jgi:chromosome segregation ATPase
MDNDILLEKVEKVNGLLQVLKQLLEESQLCLLQMDNLLKEVPVDLSRIYSIFVDLPMIVESSYERLSAVPKKITMISQDIETISQFMEETLQKKGNVLQSLENRIQSLVEYIKELEEIIEDLSGGAKLLKQILDCVSDIRRTMNTNTN